MWPNRKSKNHFRIVGVPVVTFMLRYSKRSSCNFRRVRYRNNQSSWHAWIHSSVEEWSKTGQIFLIQMFDQMNTFLCDRFKEFPTQSQWLLGNCCAVEGREIDKKERGFREDGAKRLDYSTNGMDSKYKVRQISKKKKKKKLTLCWKLILSVVIYTRAKKRRKTSPHRHLYFDYYFSSFLFLLLLSSTS